MRLRASAGGPPLAGVGSGVRAMTRGPWDAPRRWRTWTSGPPRFICRSWPAGGVCRAWGWYPCAVGASGREAHRLSKTPARGFAAHTALSVLTVPLHIAWRTVAAISVRVAADGRDTNDLPDGPTRIGIDEIALPGAPLSDLRGRPRHRPVGVGIGEGRNSETLGRFFDELEPRAARLSTYRVLRRSGVIHTPAGPTRTAKHRSAQPEVVAWRSRPWTRCGCAP